MPFKSKSQQRYMFAKHPKIAKEWADKYGVSKNLPEKKKTGRGSFVGKTWTFLILGFLLCLQANAYVINSVQVLGGSAVYSAQSTITSGTAVQLSYGTEAKTILLQGVSTNKQSVFIGASSVSADNGYEIITSTTVEIPVDAATDIYAIINDDTEPTVTKLNYLVITK